MGRPKSDRKITRISVSLDDRDYKDLRQIAASNDVSTAWLVRRAVSEFLKSRAKGQGTSPAKAIGR